MWSSGPGWLKFSLAEWPKRYSNNDATHKDGFEEMCHHSTSQVLSPIIPLNRNSDFHHLKLITAWVIRCRKKSTTTDCLSIEELRHAENYWIKYSLSDCFEVEVKRIAKGKQLPFKSNLHPLNPIIGTSGLLHVGGHQDDHNLTYAHRYPVTLQGKCQLTRLIIHHDHLQLLQAGPILLTASLNRRFYIMGVRRYVRSVTCGCIVCRREATKLQVQKMGKLPAERITPTFPGNVFATVTMLVLLR